MKKILSFFRSELGRIFIGLLFFVTALLFDYLDRYASFSLRAFVFYIIALLVCGLPVFSDAVRGILRRDLLDEKFLMSIASVGAIIVGEASEGVAVMLFFLVGEYFEHRAVAKSRESIRALMDIRADEARIFENGEEKTVDADEVEVGTVIIIRAGERVPIDSVIISGGADVDTSAITGESIPRQLAVGEEISSGCIVLNGVIKAKTLRSVDDSRASRILDLVENANERKSKTESFITRFSHYYTPIVVMLALLIAIVPPIFNLLIWQDSVYRALIFLVISCPCALVISVPMAFFGGIGGAASKGILYKGGNSFSSLANADCFVFDKTGTLTSGRIEICGVYPNGVSESELLRLASGAEYASNHPIAVCIKNAVSDNPIPEEVREFAGKGVLAKIDGKDILVGSIAWLAENSVNADEIKEEIGAVYVAENGRYIGSIAIRDKIKDEAKSSLKSLREKGVKRLVMLSGDRREIAEAVGAKLEIDEVYSELLPEDKYDKLEKIINQSTHTAYVGDGINDAPSIALSDVGIAMGDIGSDAAIESADLVIMSDKLDKLSVAIGIARKTVRIAKENIVFALGIKLSILLLGALGLANMWLAVFADVGVASLAILNSMRTLSYE